MSNKSHIITKYIIGRVGRGFYTGIVQYLTSIHPLVTTNKPHWSPDKDLAYRFETRIGAEKIFLESVENNPSFDIEILSEEELHIYASEELRNLVIQLEKENIELKKDLQLRVGCSSCKGGNCNSCLYYSNWVLSPLYTR